MKAGVITFLLVSVVFGVFLIYREFSKEVILLSHEEEVLYQIGNHHLAIPYGYFGAEMLDDRKLVDTEKVIAVQLPTFGKPDLADGFRPISPSGAVRAVSITGKNLVQSSQIWRYASDQRGGVHTVPIYGDLVAVYSGVKLDEAKLKGLIRSFVLVKAPSNWSEVTAHADALLSASGTVSKEQLMELLEDFHPEIRRQSLIHIKAHLDKGSKDERILYREILIERSQDDPSAIVRLEAIEQMKVLEIKGGFVDAVIKAFKTDKDVRVTVLAASAVLATDNQKTILKLLTMLKSKVFAKRATAYQLFCGYLKREVLLSNKTKYKSMQKFHKKIFKALSELIYTESKEDKDYVLSVILTNPDVCSARFGMIQELPSAKAKAS